MKGKQPAMMWYTGDWLKDPAVGKCSPATRGIWFDVLCHMHENNHSGILEGNYEELARLCRCSAEELKRAAQEIKDLQVGTVQFCNNKVILCNKRMVREFERREEAKKRVAKHRFANAYNIDLPECLNNENFRKAWKDWVQFRKEVNKPLTPLSISRQINLLVQYPEDSVEIINQSINCSWQGLFPLKKPKKQKIDNEILEKARRLTKEDEERRK